MSSWWEEYIDEDSDTIVSIYYNYRMGKWMVSFWIFDDDDRKILPLNWYLITVEDNNE